MVRFAKSDEMTRRPKRVAIPPTPPNELEDNNHIYRTIERISKEESLGRDIKQEFEPSTTSPTVSKTSIVDAIDAETDELIKFLDAFSAASMASIQTPHGRDGWDGFATTEPVVSVISSYLASKNAKGVTIGSPTFPSLVSVFDEGEGPCLVLNGIISPRISSPSHPYSFNKHIRPVTHPPPVPADAAGIAAIVAAFAYLHSIRHRLIGTVVLEAISDTEEGTLGTCRHMLHSDERKTLWRGDCMITAASTSAASTSIPPSPFSAPFQDTTATKTTDPATFDLETARWQRTIPAENYTPSRLSTPCAIHPVATSFSNNGKKVLGRRPSIPHFHGRRNGSHAHFWTEVGVPAFCFGVGGSSQPTQDQQSSEQHSEQQDQDADCDRMVDSGIQDVAVKAEGEISQEVMDIDRKQWIQLVKVLVLTAWDQVGLED